MRWLFFGLLIVHGLIHLLGFLKGFRIYDPPQLTQDISRPWGLAWLAAGAAMVLTALLFVRSWPGWWAVGLGAVVLSQVVIVSSWKDARFGTLANVLILAGVGYGFASEGPFGFRAQYRRAVRARIERTSSPPVVTDSDLVPLPPPVRSYLRQAGVVGQRRARFFRASWRGRIRSGTDDPWMEFTAEQHNFPDEPARFFLMKATRGGLPVDVYHAFERGSAHMRVRLLSMVPLVDAAGAEMTRAETVTLLNDLCLLAPAELLDATIRWESDGERSATASYTVGPNTVHATLSFNEAGELVNFVSEDRLRASPDGKELLPQRWSTPVGEYRSFGPWRVAGRGRGVWHPKGAEEVVYIELELLDLQIG